MEHHWPGLWRRCLQHQVATLGWPPEENFHFDGSGKKRASWSRVKNALNRIRPGDQVLIQLRGNKVGRIGEVIRLAVEDHQWNPLVPKTRKTIGEQGRHIIVRWNMVAGPLDPDLVVDLPPRARLSYGARRSAICELHERDFKRIVKAMSEAENWVPYSAHMFSEEKAISDFIGTYPNRLEDGLEPFPSLRVREQVFGDLSRSDVLLIDRKGQTVLVECKQHTPSVTNVKQLRGYMRRARSLNAGDVRGILIHGGSAKLTKEVIKEARRKPKIEILRYLVDVDFRQQL